MKTDRIAAMEQLVHKNGSATMEALMEHFKVSMNTVRRDVSILVQRGTVEKVYGGVCAKVAHPALTPYDIRRMDDEDAKRRIGIAAAGLVHDGDIIYVDSGTTTLQLVDELKEHKNLTIVTNNLEAMTQALPYENIAVIALPGHLERKTNSFTGMEAVQQLQRYNITTAFMAATGVSIHGVTNSSPVEYEIKKAAVASSEKAVLLVSRKKFGETGLMTFAPLESFSAVVTEKQPEEDYCRMLKEKHVELLLAE